MKSRIAKMVFSGTLAFVVSGCGGIRDEAKVATALQTMMVLSIESAVRYNLENLSGTDPLECSEGGSYQSNASLDSLVDFITNPTTNAGSVSGYYVFSDCKLKLCGSTITLSGQAGFTINGSEATDGIKNIELTVESNSTHQLISTGIIDSDTPEFEYDMTVEASGNSLKNITITGAPTPFQYKGKVYKASEINTLANGC